VGVMGAGGVGRAAAVGRLTVTGGTAAGAVRGGPIRVAVQAVGRVGAQGDGVDDLLPGAAMAGGAGAGAVGGDIVGGVDPGPAGYGGMTGAAGEAAGDVAGTQGHGMAVGGMDRIPAAGMAAGAVAAGGEGLPHRQADPPAVGVMTAGTGVVHLRIGRVGERRWIAVAAGAAGRCHLHQGVVARGVDRMDDIPGAGVAGEAVAAASRNTGLKGRNGCVTKSAVAQVRSGHRRIGGSPRIVAVHTGGGATDHVS